MTYTPTFIGIGAQKSGTTSLAKFLISHPDVYMPAIKEMHFFDFLGSNKKQLNIRVADDIRRRYKRLEAILKSPTVNQDALDKCMDEIGSIVARYNVQSDATAYLKMLTDHSQATSPKIFGEITPSYAILGKSSFLDMKKTLGDPKIIFLMRNPIDRFLSQIEHSQSQLARNQIGELQVSDYLDLKGRFKRSKQNVFQRSKYEKTLKILDKVFTPKNVYIGFFEDMFGPRSRYYHHQICEFLEIDTAPAKDVAIGSLIQAKGTDLNARLALLKRLAPTYLAIQSGPFILPENWTADIRLLQALG